MPTIKKLPKKTREYNNDGNRAERQRIYSTKQWKKLSKAYLMMHPLCEECLKAGKAGKVTPAVHVHHIVSFMTESDELKRLELALDSNNLEALCVACHTAKHNPKNKN